MGKNIKQENNAADQESTKNKCDNLKTKKLSSDELQPDVLTDLNNLRSQISNLKTSIENEKIEKEEKEENEMKRAKLLIKKDKIKSFLKKFEASPVIKRSKADLPIKLEDVKQEDYITEGIEYYADGKDKKCRECDYVTDKKYRIIKHVKSMHSKSQEEKESINRIFLSRVRL